MAAFYRASLPASLVMVWALTLSACGEMPLDDALQPGKDGDKKGGPDDLATPEAPPPGPAGPAVGGTSALVVPGCIDGDYKEPLPSKDAKIDDLIAAYTPANATAFVMELLKRRYPTGASILDKMKTDPMCKQFLDKLGKGAAEDIGYLGFPTHECGHVLDGKSLSFTSSTYFITDALSITAPSETADTLSRGAILGDQFNKPDCGGGAEECDFYNETYLEGEMGAQGFSMLMEEQNQYIADVAMGYAFVDQRDPNSAASDRDGGLTFLWYMQRWLKLARETKPAAYEAVAADPNWQKLILSNWGRAWIFLDATAGMKQLEYKGAQIIGWVKTPALLDEIQLIRKRTGCVK